ncbi:MAG: pyridoxamine 5'-phosphate oxidase family protein [Thiohalocapsa sp.]
MSERSELDLHVLRSAIRELLATHGTLTLATCGPDGPWAAAVFFASDDAFNLYFVSDTRTRHGRDLAVNGRAAGTVHPDCSDWGEVCGLQMEGTVSILDGSARQAALECYLAKFPRVRSLDEQPRDDDEARIASRLRQATLFQLMPERIRLIDNSRGFGFKAELRPRELQ